MFTENVVNAVPLVSMLFCTCTTAGPEEATVPVPVRLAVWGLLVALSVTVSVPVRVPVAVGVKVTLMVQLPPAATLVPQLLVCAKSPLLVPVTAMLVMPRAVLWGLLSVTV